MNAEVAPATSLRIMVISVITAAVAITVCALVAIAYMFGWLPARSSVTTPVSIASPGQQAAGTAPGVALLPGETIVTPESPAAAPAAPPPADSTPRPSIPSYVREAPPKPRAKPNPSFRGDN